MSGSWTYLLWRASPLFAAIAVSAVSTPARSQGPVSDRERPPVAAPDAARPQPGSGAIGGLFDDGRIELKPGEKADEFRITARVETEFQHLDNFDLNDRKAADATRLSPEVRVEFTYEPDDDFLTFVSVEIGETFEKKQGLSLTARERFEVREAFFHFKDVLEDVEVLVGRQRFDDGREWLYDERLDALRIIYDEYGLTLEAAIARQGLAPIDLLHPKRRGKTDNFLLRAEYEIGDDWEVAAYALVQKDRTADDESPTFFGIQSEGELIKGLSHWLELSWQRGHDNNKKLRGKAIDAGLIYQFASPLRPGFFVGYARGSGGQNGQTDRDFRQTGLQDNEDRIMGLANVRYYGELLDPELSNIEIYSFGVGFRPNDRSSVEFVFHEYRQVQLSEDKIRGSPIRVEPSGDDRDLGTEFDVIGAVRLGQSIGLEAKLGYFKPGTAFKRKDDDAVFVKTRLVFRF